MVKQKQKDEFQELFGAGKAQRQRTVSKGLDGQRSLRGLVTKPTPLFRTYKGKKYTALLSPDGTITLRHKKYNTPTAAAKAIVDRSTVNGWHFWYIEDLNGDWIKLYKHR